MLTYMFTDITELFYKAYAKAEELDLIDFFKLVNDNQYHKEMIPLSKALDNEHLSIGIEDFLFRCIKKAVRMGKTEFLARNEKQNDVPGVVMPAATRTHIAEYIVQTHEEDEVSGGLNSLIAQIGAEKYQIYAIVQFE